MKYAFKPAALSLAVAGLGALAVLAAMSARYTGLGERENFIFFRLMGVSRSGLGYIGIFTIVAAFAADFVRSRGIDWRGHLRSALNRLPSSRPVPRLQSALSLSDQAGIAIAFAVTGLMIFLTLTAFPRSAPAKPLHHLPELMIAYNLADGSLQAKAHQLVVGIAALGVLLAGLFARYNVRIFRYDGAVPAFVGVLLLTLPLLAWWLALQKVLLAFFLFVTIGAVCLLLLLLAERYRIATWIGAALVAAFSAWILIPGYIGPLYLIVEHPYDLAQLELHLTWMAQPSSVMASGFRLFADFTPSYGVIVPVIAAAYERYFGLLDMAGQLRLVQLTQVIFLILALVVFYRARGRVLPMLLALAMAGPYLTTAGPYIWHPNHSGIRHLVFPLGILALQSVLRCELRRQVAALSFAATILLMFNLETAITVICGFGIFIYLQCLPFRLSRMLSLVLPAAAGVAAAIFTFWILHRAALGFWLTPADAMTGIQIILRRLSGGITGAALFVPGFQNINFVFVPLAFVMLVHAICLIVKTAIRANLRALSARELQLGAVSVMLLVWLGYFFNFPAPWNLWVSVFLYGLILTLLFDRRWVVLTLRRPAQLLTRPWPLLAAFCVLMACASIYSDWIAFNRDFSNPAWRLKDKGRMLSGVLMPSKLVDPIVEKANYLKAKNASGRVVYTTLNTDLMPLLSGVYQPGPERDFWTMVASEDEMRTAVENLARKNPDWLLTDDETGPLIFTGQRRVFQDRVQRIVGERFTLVDRGAGWKVWALKKP